MYTFFIDESNIPRLDKIQASSPFFILGGLVIKNRDIPSVSDGIKEFAERQFPDLIERKGFKIHASDMFNLRGNFSGKNKEVVKDKIERFLEVINSCPSTFIVSAIDKAKLKEQYKDKAQDPYALAFLYACERFEYELGGTENKGTVILESRGPGLDKRYSEILKGFLSMGTKYKPIKHIKEPVFEVPTYSSPLQISDFICYAVHKYLNKNEEYLFNKIKSKFRSRNEDYRGYGLTIFPKN